MFNRDLSYYHSFVILFILFGFILTSFHNPFVGAEDEDDGPIWSMYGKNPQRTGLSQYETHINPGQLKWKFFINNTTSYPVIGADGTIYTNTNINSISAIFPNGTLKWTFEADGPILIPAIGDDGTIYFGCHDNNTYALNPDGHIKWKLENEGIPTNTLIGPDGTIFTEVWTYQTDEPFFDWDDRYLYSRHPDGMLKWKILIEENTFGGSYSIGKDGSIYYGKDHNGSSSLVALNKDGSLKWKYDFIDHSQPRFIESQPTIGEDGTIYIVNGGSTSWGNQHLVAFHPNGTLLWTLRFDCLPDQLALGPKGDIYVASKIYGKVDAVSPNGTQKWTFDFGEDGFPSASTPAIGNDGRVYFTSHVRNDIGYLWAINDKGELVWKYDLGINGSWNSPIIGIDGTIYVSAVDGFLYAIGKPDLTPSPPRNLQAKYGDGHVILNWQKPITDYGIPITYYHIYRGLDIENSILIDTIPITSPSYNDTSVKNGQLYFYQVSAINNVGESRLSNAVFVTPHGKPFPPSLNATVNRSTINLTWNASYDNGDVIIQYNVYRRSKVDNWTLIASIAPFNLSYDDENVTKRERYYYRVTAINSEGESDPSNEVITKLKGKPKSERIPGLVSCTLIIALLLALLKKGKCSG